MPIDYLLYPPDWKKRRERILYRAGGKCEWCQAANHQPHPRTGSQVVLTVAHLDHDVENWDVSDDRLAALCQACHLDHDREHHNRTRRMNRHAYGNPLQAELFRD